MNSGLKIIVALLILIVIGGIIGFQWYSQSQLALLKGSVGGEKIGLMQDEGLKKVLHDSHRIDITVDKLGSLDMSKINLSGKNFIFPSSQAAADTIGLSVKTQRNEVIFRTPLVIYSWKKIIDPLRVSGLVTEGPDGSLYLDMPKYYAAVSANKTWKDVGLDRVGAIQITSSDPKRSNSGWLFMGIIASLIAGKDQVVTEGIVDQVGPQLDAYFKQMGYSSGSSQNIFDSFIAERKPLVVGYENQIIELSKTDSVRWNAIKDDIRVLYPSPTVWSDHVLMILDKTSEPLVLALQDPAVQKIACDVHGFRSSSGLINQSLPGIVFASEIEKTLPVTEPKVLQKLIDQIK